ncbi:MAG: diguanylate cyclase [Lachnospiraceae bacterium]|nr:diguanylate cyclase [Lachnospiraceae bacterium]
MDQIKTVKTGNIQFDRTTLKIIAIISMVIDHIAWGFVDFYSPLGQFMHLLGRFTIPIMCFFVAEGFRKTHDLKKYIFRMATGAAITIIPFYLFFGEEYGYRQNIIFDYLLGLLMLTILEKSRFKKWQKAALVALLFLISVTVGGWIITPSCFILAFYYGRDFKEKAKWFIISNLATVTFIVSSTVLNHFFHFSHYDWVWWDKLYMLGFMLALPLLYRYNGKKGSGKPGNHFFYVFYPCHFLVLFVVRWMVSEGADVYNLYLGLHIALVVTAFVMLEKVLRFRPSKGQNSICFFIISAAVYSIGFIVEILARTAEGYFLACIVQYFGEYMLFIAVLSFVSACCLIEVPRFVYVIHIVASICLLYTLINTRETGFFYTYIGVNHDFAITRPELVHGPGFFLSFSYFITVCIEVIGFGIYIHRKGSRLEKKRMRLILWAMAFCWIPYGVTATGITGGFEIPAVGLLIAGVLLSRCFFVYGMLDSVALASENALDRAHEGIMVIDDRNHVSFHNSIVDRIIGDITNSMDVFNNAAIKSIIEGDTQQISADERIYEVQVDELKTNKYIQGYMIWFIDVTEHIESLRQIEEMARHDVLTGLYNRSYFKDIVNEDVSAGRRGSFLMMDMDDFKGVNDRYGHQRGDQVLKNLASILSQFPEEDMYACRVGGDEFCVYLRNTTDREYIKEVIQNITDRFKKLFREDDDKRCSVSVGAVINDDPKTIYDCSTMYAMADRKLYEAKNSGKDTYRM